MIVPINVKYMNYHMSRNAFVYFINDPQEPLNDNFIDRLRKVDTYYINVECCEINKNDYETHTNIIVKLHSLEACVIEKNTKILSHINPSEDQIEELYRYVKDMIDNREKELKRKFWFDQLKDKYLNISQKRKILNDLKDLDKVYKTKSEQRHFLPKNSEENILKLHEDNKYSENNKEISFDTTQFLNFAGIDYLNNQSVLKDDFKPKFKKGLFNMKTYSKNNIKKAFKLNESKLKIDQFSKEGKTKLLYINSVQNQPNLYKIPNYNLFSPHASKNKTETVFPKNFNKHINFPKM